MQALDPPSAVLLCLGALVALDAAVTSLRADINDAFAAGVTADEIVDALSCLAPVVAMARIVSIAPTVALALGFDPEAEIDVRQGSAAADQVSSATEPSEAGSSPASTARAIASRRDDASSFP